MTVPACPACGASLPPAARVCPRCSAPLTADAAQGVTQTASSEAGVVRPFVGPYKVLDVLGEGGMGVVFLAEQERPIRRRVALKVIKVGMDTREVIARFEAERQALALMDHPHIAQVYDAGATPEGRPYFVMEYVPGIPITNYCDKHRLSTRERLELFVALCGAVQHAHQKGVIHRDIKPSNILVMWQDGRAVPKVIDFGVAKAINQRLTEKTVFTQLGQMIGTPEYMSPEQAEMGGLNVDTTTDIYSLGVVLYELLIGAPPFDQQMLRDAGYLEIQRIIRDREPERPSARLRGLHDSSADIALRRRTRWPTLLREVRGDLDWITLKAMDKDRTRRYASVSELASDVTRHLNMQPVIAGPHSLLYRGGRFIRKHRTAVAAVALGVAASAVVSTAFLTQNAVAMVAREKINQASLVRHAVFASARHAVAQSDPGAPWNVAMNRSGGLRQTLESAVAFTPAVSSAAICDSDGHVVVAAFASMTTCLDERTPPVSDLSRLNLLTVVRGTLPGEGFYILSTPLMTGNLQVGSVQVALSGILIRRELNQALRQAAISCVVQLLAIAVLTAAASWVVFRREEVLRAR